MAAMVLSLLLLLAGTAAGKPNFVVIVADDYGFNDISYHKDEGGNQIPTTNLEALAKQGVRLEQYYGEVMCSPSRTSLLSGRYPGNHCMWVHNFPLCSFGLDLNTTLIGDRLRADAGYRTEMVGKWHLGFRSWDQTPLHKGFDRFYGCYSGAQDHFQHTVGSNDAYDLWDNYEYDFSEVGNYSTDIFTRKAVQVIENHDTSQPLFLYLAYTATHKPLQAPAEYLSHCTHIRDQARRLYCGMAVGLDANIPKVVQALVDKGMWDNTVLVFTADNGGWHEDQGNGQPAGGNNFPLRGQKLDHWEGGIRLPTFVLSPLINQSQVGLVDSVNLFHHSDWYPTFLGLAGVAVEEGLDGIDQWQTIAFGTPSPRNEILSIHTVDLKYNSKYIRDINGFKLLVNSNWTSGNFPPPENTTMASALPAASTTSTSAVSLWPNLCDAFQRRFRRLPSKSLLPELYFLVNILTDPYEQVNLANDYPDVVAELRARLEVKLQEAVTPCMLDDPLCPNWNNGTLYSWN